MVVAQAVMIIIQVIIETHGKQDQPRVQPIIFSQTMIMVVFMVQQTIKILTL